MSLSLHIPPLGMDDILSCSTGDFCGRAIFILGEWNSPSPATKGQSMKHHSRSKKETAEERAERLRNNAEAMKLLERLLNEPDNSASGSIAKEAT